MSVSTLQILSIMQERVDTFLREIFDICQSPEDPTTKSLSGTITKERAICEAVGVAVRRRRNERTLFGHLATDIVHSIFEIALDVDRVHDCHFPLQDLYYNRQQLAYMRQAINIASPPQAIIADMERSGFAPLCIYYYSHYRTAQLIDLPPGLRSCARIQTLRADRRDVYRTFRWLLQDGRPTLRGLQLAKPPSSIEDRIEPLGELQSIRHLTADSWQPPSDATWLGGLKELVLHRTSKPDVELLRVLSASNVWISMARMRVQVSQRGFQTHNIASLARQARDLDKYVADYRRVVSQEERKTQNPQSACIHISCSNMVTNTEYQAGSREVGFWNLGVDEISAFHDLVREFQDQFKEPRLTVTTKYPSKKALLLLHSLGDQNIRAIVAHFGKGNREVVCDFLKAIGAHPTDIPDRPMANAATSLLFKSLTSIHIHDAFIDLDDFRRLVEEYLSKNSKPLLEEIVLVDCHLEGMELVEVAERVAAIGITLRDGRYWHW
ncbi:hypothetical protein FRC01_007637 [Tulasnella sp. 417]|nr:hypothetical protein FRC01_007637 [Tulasnella sp. 417]